MPIPKRSTSPKHEPDSDIDIAVVDSLKVLDPRARDSQRPSPFLRTSGDVSGSGSIFGEAVGVDQIPFPDSRTRSVRMFFTHGLLGPRGSIAQLAQRICP